MDNQFRQTALVTYTTPNYSGEIIFREVSKDETDESILDRAIQKIINENGGNMPFGYDRFKVAFRVQQKNK